MNCSACGEVNEQGMQYCIFCGQAISTSLSAENKDGTCTICGKSDQLNGQFCVFCGGKTSQSQKQSLSPSLFVSSGNLRKPGFSTKAKTNRRALVMVFAILLGLLSGLGTMKMIFNALLEKSDLEKIWPNEGLVLYSCQPLANMSLLSADEKSLFLGTTGPTGALTLPNLAPGAYKLELNKNTKSHLSDIQIEARKTTVLGYPQILQY